MKVVLYGFMGAGKSTLGKALARKMDWIFVDLDEEIMKISGKKIDEIFTLKGEIFFRKLEHDVLKKIIKRNEENIILALGGGTIISPLNRKLLEIKEFKKIYLNVSVEQLIKRLRNNKEQRPLLKNIINSNFDNYIKALFESRRNQYENYADINIKIDKENFDTVLKYLYLHFNLN